MQFIAIRADLNDPSCIGAAVKPIEHHPPPILPMGKNARAVLNTSLDDSVFLEEVHYLVEGDPDGLKRWWCVEQVLDCHDELLRVISWHAEANGTS